MVSDYRKVPIKTRFRQGKLDCILTVFSKPFFSGLLVSEKSDAVKYKVAVKIMIHLRHNTTYEPPTTLVPKVAMSISIQSISINTPR